MSGILTELIRRVKVIIKPDTFEGLLVTIGALFLAGGYILQHQQSQFVGVVLMIIGIVLKTNQ